MRDVIGLERELAVAGRLAEQVGKRILRHRAQPIDVLHKEHGEVVTAADREADCTIHAVLGAMFPEDAIFSEETADSPRRLACRRVWIVDPLDGTSDFIAGGSDFTVSIGLAIDGRPLLGAIYNPVRDELFAGAAGLGVACNGSVVGASDADTPTRASIGVSRKEHARVAKLVPDLTLKPLTSMSYKLARVAAGLDDAALSLKPRKEWGSCAGVALVLAAGGRATLLDGSEIRFNRVERKQPLGMLVAGPRLHPLLLRHVQPLLEETHGGRS